MPEFLINASIWKTSDIVVFVNEQHIPGFFTAANSMNSFYNKWYLFMHFIFCDKWWIKCSSFSLTGTWHNYTEPIYINFLLTYWMIISHVFFVWLWWRSNKMKPALNHIFKSELKNLKCHVRKWTCLRLKISNIFGATALSEKRIHRQRRKELKNWEL